MTTEHTLQAAWSEAEVMAQIERTHRLNEDHAQAVAHFAQLPVYGAALASVHHDEADLQAAFLSQMAQFDSLDDGF